MHGTILLACVAPCTEIVHPTMVDQMAVCVCVCGGGQAAGLTTPAAAVSPTQHGFAGGAAEYVLSHFPSYHITVLLNLF